MAFFEVSPDQRAELAQAFALATGAPRTAAELLGRAAHDEAVGLPRSAEVLRTLAGERVAA